VDDRFVEVSFMVSRSPSWQRIRRGSQGAAGGQRGRRGSRGLQRLSGAILGRCEPTRSLDVRHGSVPGDWAGASSPFRARAGS
jgi:hypothetical protein